MNLQLTLAWRYLSGRKLRTFLTTLAILFGVLVIFGMNIILPTMVSALQANVQGMAGVVDFTVTLVSGESFSPEIVKTVQGVVRGRAVHAPRHRHTGPHRQPSGRIFRRGNLPIRNHNSGQPCRAGSGSGPLRPRLSGDGRRALPRRRRYLRGRDLTESGG
jgi:hypothetical protein